MKGKEKVGAPAGSVISMYLSGFKRTIQREKVCFNKERNESKVGQDRSGRGREFQMDEVANEKEKERQPFADRISGTVKRNLSRDLKVLVGIGDNEIRQV